MLPTYLKNKPLTKCILIQDCVKAQGAEFVSHLINNHATFNSKAKLLFFEFDFSRDLNNDETLNHMEKHNFLDDLEGDDTSANEHVAKMLALVNQNSCIVVIDSLAHMIINLGKDKAFIVLHKMKQNNNVEQIITILHVDMFNENDSIFKYFNHISTLSMKLSPAFMSEWPRVNYTYKKNGGKIIHEVEQYSFLNGELATKAIEKIDPKKLIQNSPTVIPEALTTFKISLDENDKKSKENFSLPYLPREETDMKEPGGQIHYQFDDIDDWDEEDPDDDLDI